MPERFNKSVLAQKLVDINRDIRILVDEGFQIELLEDPFDYPRIQAFEKVFLK